MKFLTQSELIELTGYRRPSDQANALKIMGVPHRVRPDGVAVVVDEDVPLVAQIKPKHKVTLNLDAL